MVTKVCIQFCFKVTFAFGKRWCNNFDLKYSDDCLHGKVNDDMGHQCACLKVSVAKDNSGSQNPYHVIVKYAKSAPLSDAQLWIYYASF